MPNDTVVPIPPVFTCCDCERALPMDSRYSTRPSLCRACYRAHWFDCQDCEAITNNEDYAGDGCCSECLEQREANERERSDNGDGLIDSYSADAPNKRFGTGPNYLGVELEVEVKGGYSIGQPARIAKEKLGDFVILKSDGSLSNGFEIVTCPASLDEQRKRWGAFLDCPPPSLRSFNTDTCGLHVHCSRNEGRTMLTKAQILADRLNVDRIFNSIDPHTIDDMRQHPCSRQMPEHYADATDTPEQMERRQLVYTWLTYYGGSPSLPRRKVLSDLTVAKIVCFVNARNNRKFMSVIAGRTSDQWARMKQKSKLSDGAKKNPMRYEAVNLQNANTIEFRIFKGTLKKESVFKAIEFCAALVAFCSCASRSIRDTMMRSELTEFIRLNKKTYPHLAAFLEAKWYGTETNETKKYGFAVVRNREEANQTEEI